MAGLGPTIQRGVSKVVILLLVLIVLLLGGVAVTGAYLVGAFGDSPLAAAPDDEQRAEADGEEEEAEPQGPAHYMELAPAITVNIHTEGGRRAILQAEVQVMTRNEEVLDGVEEHMPVIRNNLINLFGDQTQEEVAGSAGKDALREQSVDEINRVLEERDHPPEIEAVYFTSFVTQ